MGAVLKGRVVLKGKTPDLDALTKQYQDVVKSKADQTPACLDKAPDDEKSQQQWRLGKDGGIGNVVVWIQPPAGYFFKVDPDKDKSWPDKVEMAQPHCAFIPHVAWVVPTLVNPDAPTDPKKNVPSGQKFMVSNTADVTHHVKWTSDGGLNEGDLGLLPAHTKPQEVPLKGNNQLLHFVCNIHPWMDAYVWVFNHPYVAKTNPDGTYEIKNVPVGKVRITAWHEMGPNNGYLTPAKRKGDDIELKEGDNIHDFELKIKDP